MCYLLYIEKYSLLLASLTSCSWNGPILAQEITQLIIKFLLQFIIYQSLLPQNDLLKIAKQPRLILDQETVKCLYNKLLILYMENYRIPHLVFKILYLGYKIRCKTRTYSVYGIPQLTPSWLKVETEKTLIALSFFCISISRGLDGSF